MFLVLGARINLRLARVCRHSMTEGTPRSPVMISLDKDPGVSGCFCSSGQVVNRGV